MTKRNLYAALLAAPFLLSTVQPMVAQQHRNDQGYNSEYQGNRNGQYNRRHQRTYDDRNHYHHRGGIGPGKGAAIGGAGGAAAGLLLGGGVKGALIGGGLGAGVGAIAGKAHQNRQRRDEYGHAY